MMAQISAEDYPSHYASYKEARPTATPAMIQFLDIKDAYPDCLVFYRMGDFYELFYEDALLASNALDITLTKRGKNADLDIPMCGVPVHAAETYLSRLIRKGFKVAVCEQMEDPKEAKKRGAKAVVHRDVVRVVTPGTLTEETLLPATQHNFIAALVPGSGKEIKNFGLAWLDMSTGLFQTRHTDWKNLGAMLARLSASEILLPDSLLQKPDLYELWAEWRAHLTPLPKSRFDAKNALKCLTDHFDVATLESFGGFSQIEQTAAGLLIDYLLLTQKGKLPHLQPPTVEKQGDIMEIDAATRRSLELVTTQNGQSQGSLRHAIDLCETGAGSRLLSHWIQSPLTNAEMINHRLDMVSWFQQMILPTDMRTTLKSAPDLERCLGRLSLGRAGPRDLAAIRDGLSLCQNLGQSLQKLAQKSQHLKIALPSRFDKLQANLGYHAPLIDKLSRALAEDLPLLARDGGFIAPDYAPHLDELRQLRDESRRIIATLETRYRQETNISSLKIKHNNVLGYFIEVTALHGNKLLKTGAEAADSPFIHRQTMANAVRFTTTELADMAQKLAGAADKAKAIELSLFEDLTAEAMAYAETITKAAQALAHFDVFHCFALLAQKRHYAKPTIDDSTHFNIEAGRHPVVDQLLAQQGEEFIANNCILQDDQRIWLITGPNMAGKSTFLRQNALIALLAHIGCFVPARAAHIGVIDRLYSRVGAADDLARGRSTFMVEMVETATILNQATAQSLVILDEIGRGTATYDGLSIAWACVEHLHNHNKSRAIFATHYHELTDLAHRLPQLACHSLDVKEWQQKIIFLHSVSPGAADRSYGIHVAKLAGVPNRVLKRAQTILTKLQEKDQRSDDLPLFDLLPNAVIAESSNIQDPAEESAQLTAYQPLLDSLADLNPDEMTPKQAHQYLYELLDLLPTDEKEVICSAPQQHRA